MKQNNMNIRNLNRILYLIDKFEHITGIKCVVLDVSGRNLSGKLKLENLFNPTLCADNIRNEFILDSSCIKNERVDIVKDQKIKYSSYTCCNGLIRISIPILINGFHKYIFICGPFFLDTPNFNKLDNQKRKSLANSENYIPSLKEFTLTTANKVEEIVDFYHSLLTLFTEMEYEKKNHNIHIYTEKTKKNGQILTSCSYCKRIRREINWRKF